MTTEVRVPNPKGELLAGMYAQVALTLPTPHRVFEIPATALLNDASGLRVAVVGPGRAHPPRADRHRARHRRDDRDRERARSDGPRREAGERRADRGRTVEVAP